MPQLDFGNWFNQTTSVLLGFWFLVYLFIFVFLTQGVWLIKFRTKLNSLRVLLNNTFLTQTSQLSNEVNAVQLIALTQSLATTTALVSVAGGEQAVAVLAPSLSAALNETVSATTVLENINSLTLELPAMEEEQEEI